MFEDVSLNKIAVENHGIICGAAEISPADLDATRDGWKFQIVRDPMMSAEVVSIFPTTPGTWELWKKGQLQYLNGFLGMPFTHAEAFLASQVKGKWALLPEIVEVSTNPYSLASVRVYKAHKGKYSEQGWAQVLPISEGRMKALIVLMDDMGVFDKSVNEQVDASETLGAYMK